MNNRTLCIAIVWVSVLCGWIGSAIAEPAPVVKESAVGEPKLEIPETVLHLGDVLEGEELSACFNLRNSGQGVLLIRDIKAGCGCTRVDDLREVPATGKAKICLRINTMGSHGPRTFKIAVHSNDPARSVLMLLVKADIAPLLSLMPDRVFLRGEARRRLSQEVFIETRGTQPLEVHLMPMPHNLAGKIKAILTTVSEGKTYCLTVECPAADSSFRGRLMLQTNYPGREQIVVPIFRHVPSPDRKSEK